MRRSRWMAAALAAATATALLLSGCSSANGGTGSGVRIVASTNVWGDVAKQIVGRQAGRGVSITSIISDPSADPHSYEASSRTQLAVSRATLLIENGGGYDDFVGRLRKASGTKATVLDAVSISGKKPVDGELNEHVWYDFPTVRRVGQRIAGVLADEDPAHAGAYRANAAAFAGRLARLEATEAAVRQAHDGDGVAITEPVPLYLLQACGLVNRTPAQFSEAIEDGTDVSAGVLHDTEQLFAQHRVELLAYNEQTTGTETRLVLAAAKTNDVPVVGVTETLPAGKNYLSWMTANVDAVRAALG